MTNVIVSTFILSTFYLCEVTYHVAVVTFRSLSDMPDAEHIITTLDTVISAPSRQTRFSGL